MMYNSGTIQSNIEEIWEQHNISDFNNGRGWYESANSFSLKLSGKYGVHPINAAGVISALSPQKSWELNMQLADDFFRKGKDFVGHTGVQKQKAALVKKAIYKEDVCRILAGQKTINFFNNIYNPKDVDWLTVDRHMIRVALSEDKKALSTKQYEFIKKEYCIFARRVGLIPCELQAILWVAIKRIKK
jgi:hypothetical protein